MVWYSRAVVIMAVDGKRKMVAVVEATRITTTEEEARCGWSDNNGRGGSKVRLERQ
ncbi:hypothetical protein B296_00014393 [Ensete ventricosum]|uniref:Uncharacterized protein n=1 Tax=Ensete ventricosum TaxID=4639 RepID=A0A427B4S6_ENSVE|nr:hypothetical protein B296_00014393 [Ensete ventricosum]